MPSRRQERVAKRVMQELVEAFRNLKNVSLGFITVTNCEMSPDLRHAKVFVSVFGTDEEKESTLRSLKGNAHKLRGMIGRPLGLKVIPDLHFEFDESLATADRISRLIREARDTDSNPAPLTPEEIAALRAVGAPVDTGAIPSLRDAEDGVDVFESTRRDIEEELLAPDDDDPSWRPINLDELPADDDDGK
jgi:ribosome-binding factor A